LRVAGFILGAAGVAATFVALAQLQGRAGAARHSVFYNATWGVWLTFAGFAFGAIGAVLGPRKAKT
jgi:hypothetical protein